MPALTRTSARGGRRRRAVALALCLLLAAWPAAGAAEDEVVAVEEESAAAEDAAASAEASAPQNPSRKKEQDKSGATSLAQGIQGEGGIAVQTMCTNCNNADLRIGSFGNEFIRMTCDGLPVPAGLAQIYLLTVVPATYIDKIAVEKGAGRARLDGGSIGGEIEMERRPARPGLQANVTADAGDFGWRGARADVAGRRGWFGGSFVASWATSDSVDSSGDLFPDTAAFDRTTFEGRVDLELADDHRLRFGATQYEESQEEGRGRWEPSIENWFPESVEFDRQQYDASYDARLPDGSVLSVVGMYAERHQEIEELFFGSPSPTFVIDERLDHASASWSRAVGLRTQVRAGASWSRSRYEIVDFPFGPGSEREQSERQSETGYWAEGEISLGGRVTLFAGLRYADFTYEDDRDVRVEWLPYSLPEDSAWLPRAAMTWKPIDAVRIHASAGKGLRQPPPSYEEVCCGRQYRDNRGIRMEESQLYGLEVTFEPSPRVKIEASGFRTDFTDLVIHMATTSAQFQPTYQNVNVPEARYDSAGLEVRFVPLDWLTVKASGSRTRARNRTPGDVIPALIDFFGRPREKPFVSDQVPYVPERAGSAGVQLRPPGTRLTADLSAQYSGAMLIQEYDPATFDPVTFDDTIRFVETSDFWIFNARFNWSFRAGFDLFAGVDNIGDHVQDDLNTPATDYTWGPLRGRYVYGGVGYRFERRR